MVNESYPPVMVVEDDLDLRTIYSGLLEHNGYPVAGFGDGKKALDAIVEGQNTPKLIILDYLLSNNMNGSIFLNQLAEQPGIEKIPVILVSALSNETVEIAKLKSHPWVVAFFNKADIAENKLVDFVNAYFGRV